MVVDRMDISSLIVPANPQMVGLAKEEQDQGAMVDFRREVVAMARTIMEREGDLSKN